MYNNNMSPGMVLLAMFVATIIVGIYLVIDYIFNPRYKDSNKIIKFRKHKQDLINNLSRKEQCSFEGQLYDLNHFKVNEHFCRCIHDFAIVTNFDDNVFRSKEQFFTDCYYLNLVSDYNSLHKLLSNKDLLNLYKETYCDYSVLSAIILAKEVCITNKIKFISILSLYGFIPTKNDIILQNLEIYELIPIDIKNKMILFLQPSNVLGDVKLCVIEQWILMYKNNYSII